VALKYKLGAKPLGDCATNRCPVLHAIGATLTVTRLWTRGLPSFRTWGTVAMCWSLLLHSTDPAAIQSASICIAHPVSTAAAPVLRLLRAPTARVERLAICRARVLSGAIAAMSV
jgi:hypothetical protein